MWRILDKIYFLFYLVLYIISVSVLCLEFHEPFSDIVMPFVFFGILFSLTAWFLVKRIDTSSIREKPVFKAEAIVVTCLVLFFTWYVTYGSSIINGFIPRTVISVAWKNSLVVLFKKLLVFVIIPFLIYLSAGFSLQDFGFKIKTVRPSSKRYSLIFLVLSLLILTYQYFLSAGAGPVREGKFNIQQLVIGLPLLFGWLLIEVGLIEEFFFRAILQSRLAVLLKSPVGGIIVSGLIFGLAHAPGLYLRGAASEGVSEQLPFVFWCAYSISAMSVAGIFLGIIWQRTKNIYLIMALHAMVDLLSNLPDFVNTWQI